MENNTQVNPNPQMNPAPQMNPVPQVNPNDEPMTLGGWVITLLLFCIPVVNIILMLVWGFGSNVNKSKKTYCQAALIFVAIGIVLWIILGAAIGLSLSSALKG